MKFFKPPMYCFLALRMTIFILVMSSFEASANTPFVLKDGQYNMQKTLVVDELKISDVGVIPHYAPEKKFACNRVVVCHDGNSVGLTFHEHDVVGPYFRHVPKLPNAAELKRIARLEDYIMSLGKPHISNVDQGVWEWGFFSIANEKISFITILFSKNSEGMGTRIVEGSGIGKNLLEVDVHTRVDLE